MGNFRIDIEKQLSNLGRDLQQFVERVVPLVDKGQDFTPACDIIENSDEFDVRIDLSGMDKEEIDLKVTENVLSVKGERKTVEGKEPRYIRRERKTGFFSRSFVLPEDVDTERIQARFRDGVLSIEVPKLSKSSNGQPIDID